jgi:DNA helicase-2/ATP-dependent DNA helicase PcrA
MFATSNGWDDGLDEAQLEVATHGDGPLVVVAGAGTGKTRALVARLACLLDRGVPPSRILLLTFTRRAADEMLARATHLAGLHGHRRPHGGTFHSVAYQHIVAYAEVLDLPKTAGVLDPAGACDLMDLLRDDHGLAGTAKRFPRAATLVDIYSRCINNECPLRQLVPARYPWAEPHLEAVAALFREFTRRKRRSMLLDFDDLLLHWRALLGHPDLGRHLAERYPFVLVDEYQDVNSLQVDIVRRLAPGGAGLTVVGDQAQAIYGFRGADARHLPELAVAYTDAAVIRLEHNYRSQPAILDLANGIRPPADGPLSLRSDREPGSKPRLTRCYDAYSEARAVAEQILEAHQRGVQLRQQAVLVRASHHSDLVEIELSARKVPYRKYGGLRFLEAAHVRDFIAAARLLDNPHDEVAWYRVLRLHRHVGPSRAKALLDAAQVGSDDPLSRWPEIAAAAPPATRTEISESLAGLLGARGRSRPGDRAAAVVNALTPLVRRRYGDSTSRLEDLDRLASAAGAAPDLSGWLADLTLDPPVSTGDYAGVPHLDEDYVVISTIHSAKGLEWPVVHLPQLVDGAMPLDMSLTTPAGLDEEQRLLYVAVTRAQDELYLYAPLRMPHHRRGRDDRHSFAPLSRFLDESVQRTLEVVEEGPGPVAVTGAGAARVAVDLDPLWA